VRLTADEWATAQHVCTPKQLAALDLWRRGAGYRRISHILGKDPGTVRDHIQRATTRIANAQDHPSNVRPDLANLTVEAPT
jgi:DNA-binding CsgD family transcriptional regulator